MKSSLMDAQKMLIPDLLCISCEICAEEYIRLSGLSR